MDVSKIKNAGWEASIELSDGIRETYKWVLENKGKLKQVKID
jgi:GDP-L-fucose synthase